MSGRFVDEVWPPEDSGLRRPLPYRAWVPDPISDLDLRLSTHDGKAADEAAASVRRFCSAPEAKTCDWLLRVAEGCASTIIEGVFPVPRRLLRAQFSGKGRVPEVSAIANVDTVGRALEIGDSSRLRPLTIQHLQSMHERLASRLPDYKWSTRHAPGELRRTQNWIRGPVGLLRSEEDFMGPAHPSVLYVPPPADRVEGLLDDLLAFCNRTDLPPIPQAAVAHARFEEIHPFPDGNGRTGRALIHALLCKHKLVERDTTIPISSNLASKREDYFESLAAFHSGLHEHEERPYNPIINVFLRASTRAIKKGSKILSLLQAQVQRWRHGPAAPQPSSLADRVLRNLGNHPALDSELLVERYEISDRRATQIIRRLVEAGVLQRRNAGPGIWVYEAEALVSVIEAAFPHSAYMAEHRRIFRDALWPISGGELSPIRG